MSPRLLDLYAGLGGWSEPFRDRGWDVTTLDVDPAFGCDVTSDALTWEPDGPYDVVTASPPCEKFSTLTFMNGYFRIVEGEPVPMRPEAEHALALVRRTWELLDVIRPAFYVVENPRALLRRLMPNLRDPGTYDRRTVWYCHMGHPVAKPTDLWGRFPERFSLPSECHNRRPEHPDTCCCHDHLAAPRGSRTGTQGVGLAEGRFRDGGGDPRLEHNRNRARNLGHRKAMLRKHYGTSSGPKLAALRAKVPYRLGELFATACEAEL